MLCHQFIDRDKTDAVVLNADVLFPVLAALVRRAHIDRADQLIVENSIQLLDLELPGTNVATAD